MNRILKRIAYTLLIKYNEDTNNEIFKNKYDEEVFFDQLIYNPQCGRIVTFDNGEIQDAEFEFRKWDKDGEEDNGHGDLLDIICERNNLPDWRTPEFQNDSNIKIGWVITYKDCAFIDPPACDNTNVNEVKDLILKFCPNIHYIYNFDPLDHNTDVLIDSM